MKKLIALVSTLIAVSSSHASTFVRPQLAYFIPEDSGPDSTVGGFLALGYAPAGHAEHEFDLEIGWAKWKFADSGSELGYNYTGTVHCKIMPMLAHYRYRAPLVKQVAGYVQAGAGFARASVDWRISFEDMGTFAGSDSDTVAAFDVGLGLAWQVAENTSLSVGYRYLKLGTVGVQVTDEDVVELDNAGAHVFEAGLTFRF